MEAKDLVHELRGIAPSIAVHVSKESDPGFRWDGDGPDPEGDGLYPYDVCVTAKAILDGRLVEGVAYLGGSYYEPGEPVGDAHGYLPQMLRDALESLQDQAGPLTEAAHQAGRAIRFLSLEMDKRYEEAMARSRAPRPLGGS